MDTATHEQKSEGLGEAAHSDGTDSVQPIHYDENGNPVVNVEFSRLCKEIGIKDQVLTPESRKNFMEFSDMFAAMKSREAECTLLHKRLLEREEADKQRAAREFSALSNAAKILASKNQLKLDGTPDVVAVLNAYSSFTNVLEKNLAQHSQKKSDMREFSSIFSNQTSGGSDLKRPRLENAEYTGNPQTSRQGGGGGGIFSLMENPNPSQEDIAQAWAHFSNLQKPDARGFDGFKVTRSVFVKGV